ncbi:MAG: DUF1329 domain-containing protein [Limnobacter sp.]|nr:DUF1329 domain-containing protein [Limnobacter sp.]
MTQHTTTFFGYFFYRWFSCLFGTLLGLLVLLFQPIALAQLASNSASLTPLGAEKAGNAAKTIPEWMGGLSTPPAGFDASKGYVDPFAAEKPLFVIDQSNVDSHADKLPTGQVQLIKKYPKYKIPVYPSQRTATFSTSMLQAIQKEAPGISLTHNGLAVAGVKTSSVPFPQAKAGAEAIWNLLMRRPAQSLESHTASFISGPGVKPVPVSTSQTIAFAPAIGKEGTTHLFSLIGDVRRPSSLAGEALLVHDTLNFKEDARNAWVVNSGQRRVIRAPELSHAAPAGNSDSLRTVDDIYGFNGSPERFEWKLLGKKEMYIPYNNYRMSNKSLKYTDMVDDAFVKPELTRFELHRVYVLEGKLKPGMEHLYSRRVMYVDEDSWYVALMDQYDSKGELWRVKSLYLMQAYNAPGMYAAGEMQHDLNARKTIFSGFENEEPPTRFNVPVNSNDFTPGALRKMMR